MDVCFVRGFRNSWITRKGSRPMGLNRVCAGIAKEPIRGPLARQLQYQKLSESWKERAWIIERMNDFL